MSNQVVLTVLIIFGGGIFTISYFVMRKVGSYTNGSLRKSKLTSNAVDALQPKVDLIIENSKHLHGKIKTIQR